MSDREIPSGPGPDRAEPAGPGPDAPKRDLLGPPRFVKGKRLARLGRDRTVVPADAPTERAATFGGVVGAALSRRTERLRRSDPALAATVTGICAVGIVTAAFVIGTPSPQADPPAPTQVLGTATPTSSAGSTTAVKGTTDRGSTVTSPGPRSSVDPVTGAEIPIFPLQPPAPQGQSSTRRSGGDPGAGPVVPTTTQTSPARGGTHSTPGTTPTTTAPPPTTNPVTPPPTTSPPTTPPTTDPVTSPPTDRDPPTATTDPPATATTDPPATATTGPPATTDPPAAAG